MSQYLTFAIKQGDTAISLCSFSRSTIEYQIAEEFAPYEYWMEFTPDTCKEVTDELSRIRCGYNDSIRIKQERIKELGQWNNSIDDKMTWVWNLEKEIEDAKDTVECVIRAEGWYRSLAEILSEQEYNEGSAFLYFGIEASVDDLNRKEEENDG